MIENSKTNNNKNFSARRVEFKKKYVKLRRLSLVLISVDETAGLSSFGYSYSTSELHGTKTFSPDNQYEFVEELTCFHCRDKQILIPGNLVI